MAIDAAGAVHIAVTGTGSDNKGIWYLTNSTGRWVKQQVVTPWIGQDEEQPGLVDQPALAIDASDGSVWIAFAFWACADCIPNSTDGIFYVTNAGGTWNAPVLLTNPEDFAERPSLAVRNGHIYLAWHTGSTYVSRGQIGFGTNASGAWTEQQVAAAGVLPHLAFDSNGRAAILFGARHIRYAHQKQNGDFVVESLPSITGVSAAWAYSALAIDDVSGGTRAAWNVPTDDQGHYDVYLATRGQNGWSDPIVAVSGASLVGLGVHGVVHVLANEAGLVYASNAGGAFVEQTIGASGAYWQTSAFAVGPTGRPYVVFTHDDDTGGAPGIWFLEGPGG